VRALFHTKSSACSNQIWISATPTCSNMPQQIAEKSIHRSRWKRQRGRKVTPSQFGHRRQATEHRPHRRNRSVAGRQRHQSPRPATNRRNPTRNAPGPVETTPRPAYRPCHRFVTQHKGRRATGGTHRPQQAAPLPKTRTACERAVRARPITHTAVVRSRRSGHEVARHAAMAGHAGHAGHALGSVAETASNHYQGRFASARAPRVLAPLRAGLPSHTIAPGGGCYRLVALSQWPKSG
jgi:hypothetical protein